MSLHNLPHLTLLTGLKCYQRYDSEPLYKGKKNLPDAANFIPNLSQASPKGMILGLKDLRQHLGISVLSSPHL